MKTITLCADNAYLNNVEATIKSILFNNKAVRIYLLNFDIPQEWFIGVNQYINQIGSEVIDEKFNPDLLKNVHVSHSHIKPVAYARFLIPQLLSEDKVLYLDSDLVVDGSLDNLFKLDFKDKLFFAAKDFSVYSDKLDEAGKFNTGVILFNNKRLKKENKDLSRKLLELGQNSNLNNGDQSVFNNYFEGKVGEVSTRYNYQVGFDLVADRKQDQGMLKQLDSVKDPIIIHYVTSFKPFNLHSYDRLREKYWFYRNLAWEQIVQKYTIFDKTKICQQKFDGEVFVFTYQQEIQNLEKLIQKLPNIRFNVAAHTEVGWPLKELLKYPNYRVYPEIVEHNLDHLISSADAYLDINYGARENNVINRIKKREIPILSFDETADHDSKYVDYHIFENDDINGMVQGILKIAQNKRKS